MKVICIQDIVKKSEMTKNAPSPKYGDVDIVIYEGYALIAAGSKYYCLERFGIDMCFAAICFIPLSNIDETEMVRETIKETI